MEQYVVKGGKSLRLGYTTGTCAAAASKAAAIMLLSGVSLESISVTTPKGISLRLDLADVKISEDRVSCAVRKDSGDDPDVTDGALIYSEVSRTEEPGITIEGGKGIGRVTMKGLEMDEGCTVARLGEFSASEPWLEHLLEDHANGRRIPIPEGARPALRPFAKYV